MTASRQEQIKVRNLIFKKFSFCLKPKFITKIAIKTTVLKERGSETKKLRLFNIYLLDDTGYLEYITK